MPSNSTAASSSARSKTTTFSFACPRLGDYGLEDLPGYDPEKSVVRLTTKLEVTTDGEDNPVGFLGRAHPLVRRALDRVRNLSFGGAAAQGQDPRASAVEADVPEPQLLYTFLGRVSSRAGRELERVLAVQVASVRARPRSTTAPTDWSHLADPKKAIRTTDLWKNHFAAWAPTAADGAQQAAAGCFRPIAEAFCQRAAEIAPGGTRGPAAMAGQAGRGDHGQGWRRGSTRIARSARQVDPAMAQRRPHGGRSAIPQQRLAAFGSDGGQSPAKRSEADGVLRIHEKRKKILDALLDLGQPQIVPLGVLMLMPEVKHAV